MAKAIGSSIKELRSAPPFQGWTGGQERIRTSEVERQRIYSPPHLAALEPAQPN